VGIPLDQCVPNSENSGFVTNRFDLRDFFFQTLDAAVMLSDDKIK
jgi:hypothetical protein